MRGHVYMHTYMRKYKHSTCVRVCSSGREYARWPHWALSLSFEAAAEEQQIRIGTHLAGAGCSGAFATFSFSEPILPVHAQ